MRRVSRSSRSSEPTSPSRHAEHLGMGAPGRRPARRAACPAHPAVRHEPVRRAAPAGCADPGGSISANAKARRRCGWSGVRRLRNASHQRGDRGRRRCASMPRQGVRRCCTRHAGNLRRRGRSASGLGPSSARDGIVGEPRSQAARRTSAWVACRMQLGSADGSRPAASGRAAARSSSGVPRGRPGLRARASGGGR